jgi:hypothetical protein
MKKRISFCSNESFEHLLNTAAERQNITKSLFIRSVVISFIKRNHADLLLETNDF